MARITVNETGKHPLILLSTTINSNLAAANISSANVLSVICLQDVTITASTGVFSWADFCSLDMNKLPTPADNEISVNVVIDPETYFGAGTGNTAGDKGLAGLSQDKTPVQFLVVWNYDEVVANVTGGGVTNNANVGSNVAWSSGEGFITSLAPTASPEAPVWVTPMTIAVNGTMYNGFTT